MVGMNNRYQARYGNITLEGAFHEVGDVLASRGFDMTAASRKGPHSITVPHTLAHRSPALVKKLPEVKSPEIIAAEHAYRAAMGGAHAGLQTRACGSMHPEGLVCIVPVLYQPMCPHCQSESVYAHEGPHEAWMDGVLVFRWVETLEIEDLSYNAYGPMEE